MEAPPTGRAVIVRLSICSGQRLEKVDGAIGGGDRAGGAICHHMPKQRSAKSCATGSRRSWHVEVRRGSQPQGHNTFECRKSLEEGEKGRVAGFGRVQVVEAWRMVMVRGVEQESKSMCQHIIHESFSGLDALTYPFHDTHGSLHVERGGPADPVSIVRMRKSCVIHELDSLFWRRPCRSPGTGTAKPPSRTSYPRLSHCWTQCARRSRRIRRQLLLKRSSACWFPCCSAADLAAAAAAVSGQATENLRHRGGRHASVRGRWCWFRT